MKPNDFDLYCELKEKVQSIHENGERESFISFLRYCAGRLDKGDSVQAIWNDYQAKVQ